MEAGQGKACCLLPPEFPFPEYLGRPERPQCLARPQYFTQNKQWAVEGRARGKFVLVRIGPRLIAVLPDREIDLGMVDPDALITVSRVAGPTGARYDVEVRAA
jgi:hypothetical protein